MGGVHFTMLPDGSVSVGPLTMSSQGTNHIHGTLKSAQGLVWENHNPPEPCGKRKGGPRSKTFCEVYKQIDHATHIGRSQSGKWWSWNADRG